MDSETRQQRLTEVLERVEPGEKKPPKTAEKVPAPKPELSVVTLEAAAREGLTDDQRDILLMLEGAHLHPDELVEKLQIPARRVLSALTLLQVQGYVKEENGKRFTALVRLK